MDLIRDVLDKKLTDREDCVMGRVSGLTGARLVLSAATAGLLGVMLVVLKTLLH